GRLHAVNPRPYGLLGGRFGTGERRVVDHIGPAAPSFDHTQLDALGGGAIALAGEIDVQTQVLRWSSRACPTSESDQKCGKSGQGLRAVTHRSAHRIQVVMTPSHGRSPLTRANAGRGAQEFGCARSGRGSAACSRAVPRVLVIWQGMIGLRWGQVWTGVRAV